MKRLYLEDLAGKSEDEVKEHLAVEYAGDKSGFDHGNPSESDMDEVRSYLSEYDVLIAYESVGSWGCDSSSFFLIRHRETGKYEEIHGGHCSCYGFEGQFKPEDAPVKYLQSDKFYFYAGGYDNNSDDNERAVKEYLSTL